MPPAVPQRELRAYAEAHDHTLVGFAPIGRTRIFDEPAIRDAASTHDATPAQVCLAWAIGRGVVPIPKGTGDHVAENFAARDLDLTESELDAIDGIDERRRIVDPDMGPWNE